MSTEKITTEQKLLDIISDNFVAAFIHGNCLTGCALMKECLENLGIASKIVEGYLVIEMQGKSGCNRHYWIETDNGQFDVAVAISKKIYTDMWQNKVTSLTTKIPENCTLCDDRKSQSIMEKHYSEYKKSKDYNLWKNMNCDPYYSGNESMIWLNQEVKNKVLDVVKRNNSKLRKNPEKIKSNILPFEVERVALSASLMKCLTETGTDLVYS